MRIFLPILLLSVSVLAGCSTNANPVNWFNRDAPDEDILEPIDADNPLIPDTSGLLRRDESELGFQGSTIDAITDLIVERVPGGILIRATGRAGTQGVFNARLTPLNEDELPEDGVLTYALQAENKQLGGGAPETREVIVGRKLTDQEISEVRTIRVEGLQNALERRL